MKELLFVTSNVHKFHEAEMILKPYKIRLEHCKYSYPEIRSESVENVALESARAIFEKMKKPLIVEDSGLFISALHNFPGTYSAWVYKKIGNNGIVKLMEGRKNRKAYFLSCIAYADSKTTKTFLGRVDGTIHQGKRMSIFGYTFFDKSKPCFTKSSGFGYDPIFIPKGKKQTFAENETLKNKISHRFNAFTIFAKWYNKSTRNQK